VISVGREITAPGLDYIHVYPSDGYQRHMNASHRIMSRIGESTHFVLINLLFCYIHNRCKSTISKRLIYGDVIHMTGEAGDPDEVLCHRLAEVLLLQPGYSVSLPRVNEVRERDHVLITASKPFPSQASSLYYISETQISTTGLIISSCVFPTFYRHLSSLLSPISNGARSIRVSYHSPTRKGPSIYLKRSSYLLIVNSSSVMGKQ